MKCMLANSKCFIPTKRLSDCLQIMKTETMQDCASEGRPVTHRDHAISQPAAPPIETVTVQVRNQLRSALIDKRTQEHERFENRCFSEQIDHFISYRGRYHAAENFANHYRWYVMIIVMTMNFKYRQIIGIPSLHFVLRTSVQAESLR